MNSNFLPMFLCWSLLCPLIFAPSASTEDYPSQETYLADAEPLEQQILIQLHNRTELKQTSVTLAQLVDILKARGIPTYLALKQLDDEGISQDLSLTLQSSGRLIDTFELALEDNELGWTISNQCLVITTKDDAEERLTTRIYDVCNLIEFAPTWHESGNLSGHVVYAADFDSLTIAIQQTIDPDSWDDAGGLGNIEPYSTRRMRVLAISQTLKNHLQIQRFLHRLTRLGGTAPLESPIHMAEPRDGGRTTRLRSSQLRMTAESTAVPP